MIERNDVNCQDGASAGANCERYYKPSNYDAGKFYGLSTLRLGLEKSRNAMTVRLANDIGMEPIMDISKRFGIYENPRPELAWALGAGETTLLKMATAYSEMINSGKSVTPTILDRVQDGTGKTIFVHGNVSCTDCQQQEYEGNPPPELPDLRTQIIDPVTAYQMTYMMQGVVENGTGGSVRSLGRPLGGKTGTTNDSKDAWFMGFSPDLVVGVYVGMDTPESMGRETGSSAAVPIFKDFMEDALEGTSPVPFRIPEGVTLAPVNRNTGASSYIGAPNFILEAYRPGTEPGVGELSSSIRVGSGSDTRSDYGQNRRFDQREALENGDAVFGGAGQGEEGETEEGIFDPTGSLQEPDSQNQTPDVEDPEPETIDDGLY